jgi:hypothetical protein
VSSDPGAPDGRGQDEPGAGPPDPDAGHPGMQQSPEWDALGTVISGPVVFGGAGWLLDHWLGTGFLVAVGILGGMALSLYLLWFRYGTH